MTKRLRLISVILTLPIAAVSVLISMSYSPVMAGDIANRSVKLSTSTPSATGVDHTFGFFYVSPADVGSVEFEYCENDPFPGEPCVAPVGIDVSTANLFIGGQTGETGFSIHPSTFDGTFPDNNVIVMQRGAITVTPQQSSYRFEGVRNPSATQTFFVRITTYQEQAGRNSLPTQTIVDTGGVAASTNNSIVISAEVPPYLTFCVGLSILNHDCSTAAGSLINLGAFSRASTVSGISKLTAFTNALNGYSISMSGTTMTSGNNAINPIATPSVSTVGSKQFGLNLRANSTPNQGLEPVGPGTAQPTAPYNQLNRFKFANGDEIVRSNVSSDRRTFTATYIVNIDDQAKKGLYSTTLTYIATATF